jgi:hypothetical protein
MKPSKMLASITLAALLPCSGWAADKVLAPRHDEVQVLRDEVRALRLELRELKQALAARSGSGDKMNGLPAVK